MNRYGSYVNVGSSRLAVKSLFNSKFDLESTAPGKTDPTRLEVLKSTQVDLFGSTPMRVYILGIVQILRDRLIVS